MATISVIISIHNNVKELPAAIKSIVCQSYRDFEVISIDDGSTDGSGELLDRYAIIDKRIKVLHQANAGLGPSLHRACQLAAGEYIARQDADDISAPTRLERQLTYMQERRKVIMCGTWAWFIDEQNKPRFSYEPPDNDQSLRKLLERGSNPFVHGSVMFRRAIYEAEGIGYRFLGNSQDFDLWLRLAELGSLGMVQSVEYLYWLSVGGISFGNQASRAAMVRLALRLSAERKMYGYEMTEWLKEQRSILGERSFKSEGHEIQRRTLATYSAGLNALVQKDWRGYKEAMTRASLGTGLMVAKAKWHARAAFLAPVVYLLYKHKYGHTHMRYIVPLHSKFGLPSYAVNCRQ